MKTYESILVLVDDRPESVIGVERALALAEVSGAKVTMVSVLEPLDDELAAWPNEADRQELLHGVARAEVEWQTQRIRPLVGTHAVRVIAEWGRPCVAVLRRAIDEEVDLVIKTARGRVDGRRVFFGSTAMHLFRKSPCPVWVVAPTRSTGKPAVVAAVDPGREGDAERQAIADKVLRHARSAADHLGGELHVVHAWNAPPLAIRREADVVETCERRAREALGQALNRSGVAAERVALVRGAPDEEVPAYARSVGAELIVMGSVGHAGVRGLLMGERAEEILSRVDCGVLAVKPDGFVSPLDPRVRALPERSRPEPAAGVEVERVRASSTVRGGMRTPRAPEAHREASGRTSTMS